MRPSARACLVIVLGMGLSVAEAQAQTCFRGRPLPACRGFWITEFAYLRGWREAPVYLGQLRVQGSGRADDVYFTGEVGHMANIGPNEALGATLHVATELEDDARYAVKVRYRRWLAAPEGGTSLEISPGIILGSGPDGARRRMPGLTLHAALNLSDRVGLVGGFDAVPLESDGDVPEGLDGRTEWTEFTWYGGIKAGSGLAFIAALATGILLVVAAGTLTI